MMKYDRIIYRFFFGQRGNTRMPFDAIQLILMSLAAMSHNSV